MTNKEFFWLLLSIMLFLCLMISAAIFDTKQKNQFELEKIKILSQKIYACEVKGE